jgi:hypothetical protein
MPAVTAIFASAVSNSSKRILIMSISKNVKVALASTLLVTLVSCGGDKKSKSSPETNFNPVVQSYNWKLLNGRGFPEKAYVEINDVPVLNECNHKNILKIDRSSKPEMLAIPAWDAPKGEFAKVVIDDCSNMGVSTLIESVRMDINKSGAVAEVTLSI